MEGLLKLLVQVAVLCFLTYVFGWWYLVASCVAYGYFDEDMDKAIVWPFNLGIEIRRYLNG